MKQRLPLAYQILILQVAIVLVAALAGTAAAIWEARQQLDQQYEQRALAVAESVAATPSVRSQLSLGDPGRQIQAMAEQVRRSTGATYVVVADSAGIRYSHPNPALIGRRVDEDPGIVLSGQTWTGIQRGTLGVSARGKAPIFLGSRVIGMVSVGYLETKVSRQLLADLPDYGTTILVGLGLGVLGSLLLSRRLKKQTFGLEPYEIAGLLEEREASFRGIREGALATSEDGRITLANAEAIRLLGLPEDCVGRRISQVLPPGRLANFILGRLKDEDEMLLVAGKPLFASRRPVTVRGREVGNVVTVIDSSELNELSVGMGVAGLTDAIRAQAHEFSNRLHTIAGLIELGRAEDAMRLIDQTTRVHQELSEALIEQVGDPVLSALLLAKSAVASERGIELEVSGDGLKSAGPLSPNDLITVVGNLVDNALDAAASSRSERRVKVGIEATEDEFLIRVSDTGPGVPQGLSEKVFAEGFSTKPRRRGRARGLGLTLVREVVRRYGGEIGVSEGQGAEFTVRLPVQVVARR